MMHELGPLALRQLELLITRAPPGLRFVLATRHDVRRRADVQAEQDRRVAGMTAPAQGLVLWKVFYKKPD